MTQRMDLTPTSGRWTAKYKAKLLTELEAGELNVTDLYGAGISKAEIDEWRAGYAENGLRGLKTTKRISIRGHRKTHGRKPGKRRRH